MQEHIEWLKSEHKKYTDQAQKESSMQILGYAFKIDDCIKHAESMLEKEKEAIMNAYAIGWSDGKQGKDLNDLYYFETFSHKEE